jgi:hypothetical protein
MSDKFRTLNEIFEVDSRNTHWIKVDKTGFEKPYDLADWYATVDSIRLLECVPEEIQVQFDTVKNTLLYSWFTYRFLSVAELYSYVVLENALRIKLGHENNQRIMLRELLKEAVSKGLLNDSGFHVLKIMTKVLHEEQRGDETIKIVEQVAVPEEELRQSIKYCEILCECIPALRNTLAHGKVFLHLGVLMPVKVHSEIINMLFQNKK